ncbi:MAG: hypothetical protein ABI566_03270 [Pseudolysinimonas sp.]
MRRAAVIAVFAGLALLLSGCIGPFAPIGPMGQDVSNLFSITFSQSQAIPDFDDTEYELEGMDVDAFRDLLTEFDVDPGDYTSPDTAGCTGGLSTTLTMGFYGGGNRTITIDSCGRDDDSFEVHANAFFTAWRDAHTVDGGLPNDDIHSLTFSQSQAIEGFDDAEYQQRSFEEVRRFRDLLDEYGVQASTYEPPASEPCDGGLATTVTIEYLSTEELVDLVLDDCTIDDGFTSAANDLFTEWRETLAAAA